jgi:hypothetical protein
LESGLVHIGAILWFVIVTAGAMLIAYVGVRPFQRRAARFVWLGGVGGATLIVAGAALTISRAFDVSEAKRQSLPPAAEAALRALDLPLRVDVYLERDDARRQQAESDVLRKLRLARPDLIVTAPLDAYASAERDEGYGRLVIRAGEQTRETYSTSRKEVTTLIFEAASQPMPDWSQPDYPGYPVVVGESARGRLGALAYGVLPFGLAFVGIALSRARRRS